MSRNYKQIKKTVVTVLVLLAQILVFGQEKLVKDIDNDGINDTVYFDEKKIVIVCKLSTNNFKPIYSKQIETMGFSAGITATRNGFAFYFSYNRAGNKNQFRYNAKTKKIQLIGMSNYEQGNAANEGAGESSVNLLTGNFIGNWIQYENIKMPTVKTKMYYKTINLEDFDEEIFEGYSKRSAEEYYKKKKEIEASRK